MGFGVQSWTTDLRVVATIFHSIAISCTVFRLSYRWYTFRFWWEDAWAALALLSDILCLTCTWMQQQVVASNHMPLIDTVSNWLVSIAFTCVVWSARMSVVFSIIRVANPPPTRRRCTLCVAAFFGVMWCGLLLQKIHICSRYACIMNRNVAIAQLSNSVSDILLVAMPIHLLRDVKLSSNRRILIACAFSASLLITVVTILHSALLFGPTTPVTAIIAHVKAALSLIVCNLLVLATFSYRLWHRSGGGDLDGSFDDTEAIQFTSVDLTQLTSHPCSAAGGNDIERSTGSVPTHATKSTGNPAGSKLEESSGGCLGQTSDCERGSHARS
ncbi:hypothetical protein BV22DRAFT_624772 [Leucogyrophana mollusca]|uniref:Uncharacterized protein n=1 Tax=Leucogyrophana mollusca TaxID=85980 RepID=A0ACB8BB58_9AGAM|nr:hypothetical protein BV22DRAFT_624772 [Leucogyrophana mollusca]